ncbi:MAG: septal ring lytic transglycosylase RlpA family protein [Deltaproteobacteria bacterium]|jgi:rare lipoprotein A (peptidoglycan hydrolase)|nr:septal ring lytic transglycosylase RlpA family protein [Deltaproteobacteria bacterium]
MKKITICSVVVCLCLLNGGRAQAADAVAPGLGLVAAAHAKPAKTHQVKPDKAKNAKFGKASKGHSGSGASQAQTGKPAKRAKREPLPPASPDLPQSGIASWVGPYFKDRPVAVPGERYIMEGFTAAHRAVAFHSILKVTDLDSGRSVLVRVNDRGPYIAGRIIDLAKGAAEYLGFVHRGIANVRLELAGNVKDPAQRYYIRMRPSAGAGRAGLVQGFGPFEKFDEAAALLASLYKHYPDAELLTVREQG